MTVHNADIAKAFEEVADLLELGNENIFRIRAYRNAARTVASLGSEVTALLKEERDLSELPGIGKDLAGKIKEIVTTAISPSWMNYDITCLPSRSSYCGCPGLARNAQPCFAVN